MARVYVTRELPGDALDTLASLRDGGRKFGVVCVDSGYELHVGGNGGIKVRATDLLCRVATEAGWAHLGKVPPSGTVQGDLFARDA